MGTEKHLLCMIYTATTIGKSLKFTDIRSGIQSHSYIRHEFNYENCLMKEHTGREGRHRTASCKLQRNLLSPGKGYRWSLESRACKNTGRNGHFDGTGGRPHGCLRVMTHLDSG